jgi:hypothetical protein
VNCIALECRVKDLLGGGGGRVDNASWEKIPGQGVAGGKCSGQDVDVASFLSSC